MRRQPRRNRPNRRRTVVDEGVQRDASPDRTIAAGGSPNRRSISRSLPSLESIAAETDIRAFLAPGVPSGIDPCGASPRVGRRSQDSRFCGARGERLGLHHAGRHAGVRTAGDDRRASARRRATWWAAISSRTSRSRRRRQRKWSRAHHPRLNPRANWLPTQPVAPTVENPGRWASGISQDEPVKSDDKPAACDELTRLQTRILLRCKIVHPKARRRCPRHCRPPARARPTKVIRRP